MRVNQSIAFLLMVLVISGCSHSRNRHLPIWQRWRGQQEAPVCTCGRHLNDQPEQAIAQDVDAVEPTEAESADQLEDVVPDIEGPVADDTGALVGDESDFLNSEIKPLAEKTPTDLAGETVAPPRQQIEPELNPGTIEPELVKPVDIEPVVVEPTTVAPVEVEAKPIPPKKKFKFPTKKLKNNGQPPISWNAGESPTTHQVNFGNASSTSRRETTIPADQLELNNDSPTKRILIFDRQPSDDATSKPVPFLPNSVTAPKPYQPPKRDASIRSGLSSQPAINRTQPANPPMEVVSQRPIVLTATPVIGHRYHLRHDQSHSKRVAQRRADSNEHAIVSQTQLDPVYQLPMSNEVAFDALPELSEPAGRLLRPAQQGISIAGEPGHVAVAGLRGSTTSVVHPCTCESCNRNLAGSQRPNYGYSEMPVVAPPVDIRPIGNHEDQRADGRAAYYLPPREILRLRANTPINQPRREPSVASIQQRDSIYVGGDHLLSQPEVSPGAGNDTPAVNRQAVGLPTREGDRIGSAIQRLLRVR